MEIPVDFDHLVEPDVLVAHVDRADDPLSAFAEFQLVEGRHAVSGSDFTGVHFVIAEVLIGNVPVFIAQEPVAADNLRVEFDLHLGIPGNNLEGSGEVLDEYAASLREGVHVVVRAIPIVGQLLHEDVVVVAHAETDSGEGHALIYVVLDLPQYRVGASVSNVAHPVGKDHDAGDAIRRHLVNRQLVRDFQAILDICGTTRLQGVDGLQDLAPLPDFGGFEQYGATVAVGHDGYLVVGAEFVHQQPERLLHEFQPVFAGHGA